MKVAREKRLHGQLAAIGSDDPVIVVQVVFGLSRLVLQVIKVRNLGLCVLQNLTDHGHGDVRCD